MLFPLAVLGSNELHVMELQNAGDRNYNDGLAIVGK